MHKLYPSAFTRLAALVKRADFLDDDAVDNENEGEICRACGYTNPEALGAYGPEDAEIVCERCSAPLRKDPGILYDILNRHERQLVEEGALVQAVNELRVRTSWSPAEASAAVRAYKDAIKPKNPFKLPEYATKSPINTVN